MTLAGVYIHFPFCRSRCSYCDFATEVWRSDEAVERYVDALCKEISAFGSGWWSTPVHLVHPVRTGPSNRIEADTIYFGGGTPSLLTPDQLERILTTVHNKLDIHHNAEITMEMNPATVTPETLRAFRSLGVNRASFGVQTFNDRDLKLLARGHDANDARSTFHMLRDAGFTNVSFDLIAGLPAQTMDDWILNLVQAVKLNPEHISLYLLEIHSVTPLAEQVRSGRRKPIDEELAAEMYEVMLDRLAAAGYEQYEISNFCRSGHESRHNSKYWTLDPVVGFGLSAHSFDGTQRFANERDTAKYIEMIERSGTAEVFREYIDLVSEFVFLGLRMESGIDLDEIKQRFGKDILAEYGPEIERLRSDALITAEGSRLLLTRKGKLYSNEVFAVFV